MLVLYSLYKSVSLLIWLSKGITTEPHLISPIPDAVLVTNLSCASDTPITSAILELSVLACFKSATIRKNITIDGQEIAFKASAAIPRIYRLKFQRDIYKDLAALEKSIGDGKEEASNLDLFSLEMFENIAFIMAKHADASIPDTPEEWLDQFNTFSIYQVLPQLIELWGLNVKRR